MRIPNPEHVKLLKEAINASPYYHLISMRLCEVESGRAVMEMALTPQHMQHFGVVHGGSLASMIDSATAWALYYSVEDEHMGLTSIDLKLNYLTPAVSGTITARARELKVGRTFGYGETSLYDEKEKLIAHGTSTVMLLPGKDALVRPPFPPKFID